MPSCSRILTACLLYALSLPSHAAVVGSIRGIVHSSDHRPLGGATVIIRQADSQFTKQTVTDDDGAFEFTAIPIGDYKLEAGKEGFQHVEQRFSLQSTSAPIVHLQLPIAEQRASITVAETAASVATDSATLVTNISRQDIRLTPGADNTNSVNMITSFVPGAYVVHDQLHVRGGHQVTWAVDGIPVPNTNIASNVGPQFDPKDADYIEAQRGSYSAEFGDRTYGVFNVVPRTGFERDREGELVTTFGNYHQTNDQLSFGSHTERFAYYASITANRSDLGLETPVPQVIHDRVWGLGGFSTLIFNPNQNNQLRLVSSIRRDDYQIPNDPDLQASGVHDNEAERDGFVNFSWIRTISPSLITTVAPFYHYNQANYEGGPGDPLSALDDRTSQYTGAEIAAALTTTRNNARAELYGFFQHDAHRFGLNANDGSGITALVGPPSMAAGSLDSALSLNQLQTLHGGLAAAAFEDQFRLTSWLTLTGGVRLTHFSGTVSENAADPRIGGSLRVPKLNWTFRAFYGRFYQEPPLATITGPLLDLALQSGVSFIPLHGERDEERQFGVSIPLHTWTLDVDHSSTRARNYFDHDVIGNSNIFFPLTIANARLRAWEVTLRTPRYRRGEAHLAYSRQWAQGEGAVSGGLTDFSPPSPLFFLDHDQRDTLSVGGNLILPRRSWLAANVYYGSGFLDGDGPGHLPPHTTFDISAGKQFAESLSISVNALNVANRRYMIDASSTFGGTHFANPRELYVQLRWKFHY